MTELSIYIFLTILFKVV